MGGYRHGRMGSSHLEGVNEETTIPSEDGAAIERESEGQVQTRRPRRPKVVPCQDADDVAGDPMSTTGYSRTTWTGHSSSLLVAVTIAALTTD